MASSGPRGGTALSPVCSAAMRTADVPCVTTRLPQRSPPPSPSSVRPCRSPLPHARADVARPTLSQWSSLPFFSATSLSAPHPYAALGSDPSSIGGRGENASLRLSRAFGRASVSASLHGSAASSCRISPRPPRPDESHSTPSARPRVSAETQDGSETSGARPDTKGAVNRPLTADQAQATQQLEDGALLPGLLRTQTDEALAPEVQELRAALHQYLGSSPYTRTPYAAAARITLSSAPPSAPQSPMAAMCDFLRQPEVWELLALRRRFRRSHHDSPPRPLSGK